jgi:hypothetical protein
VETRPKETRFPLAALAFLFLAVTVLLSGLPAPAQHAPDQDAPDPGPAATSAAAAASPASPPPSTGGFFPLAQVHRGLMATAWTVFEGTRPEPMQVEILGILRGARGPGQDLILARLQGAKPEYTGVVEGMSGSPVYVGGKLLGSLSYRIGVFSKEPIAGITPIEQMLEVRNLPIDGLKMASAAPTPPADATQSAQSSADADASLPADEMNFKAMETPLVMTGFAPQAVEFWQKQLRGTGLESVAAGGLAGASDAGAQPSSAAAATLEPGSAVSMQLVRGDVDISATCTVTYIDPKQLLACGHPVLQAGQVSLPMTTADVVATLASPLEAFKIINTGATVGAFTEDRESGIRGVLGASAHMIPMHVTMDGPDDHRKLNVELLDLPSLTSQAMMVVLYDSLLQANSSTASTSYHLTGNVDLQQYPAVPLDVWASPGEALPASLMVAVQTGERFAALYTNGAREGTIRGIDLHVEEVPRRLGVTLEGARLISNDIVHAGDTVEIEATLRPWQQPERNVRIAIHLPGRLAEGNLRILVSDGETLDRTLNPPHIPARPADLETVLAQARNQHGADRIYVSLLIPEAQAGMNGETLASLPLSMANALEPVRTAQEINLNGESAEVAGDAPAGGVLSGFQILNLHIDPGGGLH